MTNYTMSNYRNNNNKNTMKNTMNKTRKFMKRTNWNEDKTSKARA